MSVQNRRIARFLSVLSILILLLGSLLIRDARALSTITVDSTDDDTTAGNGMCTLREAVNNANSNSDTTSGDCVAGSSGVDTIDFAYSLSGDTITLGETFGWIRELRARFVSVITRDGREFLIPNEDFITHEVINWSFSDKWVRLDVPFGVTYDSNPHEVTKLAIDAASHVDRVDTEVKAPVCWITAFGDSSIDFLLRFWITDPQEGLTNIRGKVLLALWDAFKEHGIQIPYPHREVLVKTPVKVTSDSA